MFATLLQMLNERTVQMIEVKVCKCKIKFVFIWNPFMKFNNSNETNYMYIHQQTHAIFIINTVLSIRFVDNLNTNKNLFALSHLLFIITGP